MHWVLVILLIPSLAIAGGASFPSEAFYDNPATCSTLYPTVCDDAAVNAALDEFPYWENMMWRDAGAITVALALGVYDGYLYVHTCQHCSTGAEVCFYAGPKIGQCFEMDSVDASSVYRQFQTPDGMNQGSASPGDRLTRLLPKAGEDMPQPNELKQVRVLPPHKVRDIPDGALMLAVGSGRITLSKTKAQFAECATTTAMGNPGTGCDGQGENCSVDACCIDPQRTVLDDLNNPREIYTDAVGVSLCTNTLLVAGKFDGPSGSGTQNRVCHGGDGDYAACTSAGLTFLGPTWEYSSLYAGDVGDPNADDAVNWSVFEYNKYKGNAYRIKELGSNVQKDDTSLRRYLSNERGDSTGHCIGFDPITSDYSAPSNQLNAHANCVSRATSTSGGAQGDFGLAQGDSGGPTFVWFQNKWWFLNGAADRYDGSPEGYQAEWSRWKAWTGHAGGGLN